jgi:hypothetical protein
MRIIAHADPVLTSRKEVELLARVQSSSGDKVDRLRLGVLVVWDIGSEKKPAVICFGTFELSNLAQA